MLSKNKKEYDKAIDYFKKCIDIDNSYVDAYVALGDVYYEKGLYGEELQILRKAILLDPNNSDAYYSLAVAISNKQTYILSGKSANDAITLRKSKEIK